MTNPSFDFKVCIMKNRVVEDINSQWGDSGTTAWGATDATPAWQNNDSFSTPVQPVDDTPVEGKHNFIYYFGEKPVKI